MKPNPNDLQKIMIGVAIGQLKMLGVRPNLKLSWYRTLRVRLWYSWRMLFDMHRMHAEMFEEFKAVAIATIEPVGGAMVIMGDPLPMSEASRASASAPDRTSFKAWLKGNPN